MSHTLDPLNNSVTNNSLEPALIANTSALGYGSPVISQNADANSSEAAAGTYPKVSLSTGRDSRPTIYRPNIYGNSHNWQFMSRDGF